MPELIERVEDRLADFTRDKRVLTLSWMAVIVGALSAVIAYILVWLIAVITNIAFYQQFSSVFQSPDHHRLGYFCNSRAGDRRTGDRFDGALWLGKDSRPRYTGSARSDSFWSQPHGAENRRAQAFIVRNFHRHRRPLRRRRSDHHDRRRGGLDFRAIFSSLFRGTKNAARRQRRRRHGRYLHFPRRRRPIGHRASAL